MEQHRPLDQLTVGAHPSRIDSPVAGAGPDHGTQSRQVADPQVDHHLPKRRAGNAVIAELGATQLEDVGAGGDGLDTVGVVVGVDHSDDLNQERIEPDLVVAAISCDERHRGGGAPVNASHPVAQPLDLVAQGLQDGHVFAHPVERAVWRRALGL